MSTIQSVFLYTINKNKTVNISKIEIHIIHYKTIILMFIVNFWDEALSLFTLYSDYCSHLCHYQTGLL